MFVLYTPWVSPHQIPLAKELVKILGVDEFRYFYTEDPSPHQLKWGWDKLIAEPWIEKVSGDDVRLLSCDALLTYFRHYEVIQARAAKGLKTFYSCERWFKPMRLGGAEGLTIPLPGSVRMLVPSFRKMARQMVSLANDSEVVRFLPIGPWAKKDFLRLGLRSDKIVDWGYYVKPSDTLPAEKADGVLKLLWCGRLLGWKRVGDIVRAAGDHIGWKHEGGALPKISLTIVGDGPEKNRLIKLVKNLKLDHVVTFIPSQPVDKIREIMRAHDTFIMASNAYEGWGAVVSEALVEGMNVIGTHEAGASAAILPKERLYRCGDVRRLSGLFELEYKSELPPCSIGEWTPDVGAKKLIALAKGEL